MFETLNYETKDGIAYVTLDMPDSLNALSCEMLSELLEVCNLLEDDQEVQTVILTGSGRAFAAGADISQMVEMTGLQGQKMMKLGASVMNRIENLSKPVIAAVNGYALGGGCELAMACDIRIVSDKAVFGQPEVNLGIIPGFGGTQRLPRLAGKGMAKYMIMTGEYVDAAEAFRIGLADKIYPDENLIKECEKVALKIMSKAPVAVRAAKRSINKGAMLDMDTAVAFESEACSIPFCSEDRTEGMKAFLEKRKAVFNNK